MFKCSHNVVLMALMFSPAFSLLAAAPQEPTVHEPGVAVATGFIRQGEREAPSVVIHPSQIAGDALNQCSYELIPRTGGPEAGFLLRLQIPDSVKSVELIPVSEQAQERNFQLRVEEVDSEPVMKTVSAQKRIVRGWRNVEDLLPEVQSDSPMEGNPVGSRFKSNPFFKQAPDHQASRSPEVTDQLVMDEPEMDVAQSEDIARPLPVSPRHQPRVTTPTASAVNAPVTWIHLGDDQVGTESEPAHAESSIPTNIQATPQAAVMPRVVGPADAQQQAAVSLEVQGPASMEASGTADFMISICNTSDLDLVDFDVRLTMPEGLAITVYDREADVDLANRSYCWRIPHLSAREATTVQYRVQCRASGRQLQQFEVGYDGAFQQLTSISTDAMEATASVSVLQR